MKRLSDGASKPHQTRCLPSSATRVCLRILRRVGEKEIAMTSIKLDWPRVNDRPLVPRDKGSRADHFVAEAKIRNAGK